MAKERYGRIGKKEEEQEPPGKEQEQHQPEQTTTDRNIDREEEWQEALIFDKDDNNIDFARTRATKIKNIKRIHLPKPLKPTQESMMEIRKHRPLKTH